MTEKNPAETGEDEKNSKIASKNSPPTSPSNEAEQSDDMITKATAAAIRLEEANKTQSELLDRQERMMVEQKLGGETEAGKPQKLDESPEEYKERIMKGEN